MGAQSEIERPVLAWSTSRRARDLQEADDRTVLAALASGEEQALDELVTRKSSPLHQTVTRITGDPEEAKDIVQLTFVKVWENRERYDDRYSPNTWIYRIATNLAIDHLRSRRTRNRSEEPVRLHLESAAASRARHDRANLHEGEIYRIFSELSKDLTERQRVVFLLREVEGRPSSEVAEIVGCRESTVRNHLFNARRVLQQTLAERYPEYAGPRGDR